jgi:hypothetical protein
MTPKPLTPGERRAWRAGFLAGVEHATKQLELFRIKFACRGVDIDVPQHWPTVERSERRQRGGA